ncbi:MAG: response regulator [Candidatus Hatepunaea meridiana]|nr:response regulator [Candidatus Hatepunaea meridiana]
MQNTTKHTILIIEDEPLVARMESRILESAGYYVEVAINGADGLNRIERGGIHLVVLDYNLPDMLGRDVIAALNDKMLQLPVIMVTAQGDEQLATEMLKSGVMDYLPKAGNPDFVRMLPLMVKNSIERFAFLQNERKLQKQIRQSENTFRQIFEAIPDPALLFKQDTNNKIFLTGINQTCSNLAENTITRFIGRELNESSKFMPEIIKIVHSVFDTNHTQHGEIQLNLSVNDGEQWFTLDCVKFKENHALLIMRDVTLQMQAKITLEQARDKLESRVAERTAKLEESEKRLTTLIQNVPDAILYQTGDGIEYLSLNIEKVLGYSRNEFFEKPKFFENLIHPDNRNHIVGNQEIWLKEGAQGIHKTEFRIRHKDGRYIWLSDRMSIISNGSNGDKHLGVMIDVTERKQAEEALIQAKHETEETNRFLEQETLRANEMALQAETANAAKSEFLANMSHEIRTPMNAILGFTEILESKIKNEEYKEYIASISSSGQALLRIINDILDLSKIEAGKLELDYTAVNPHFIFREIEQIFFWKIRDKGLDFVLEIDRAMPKALLMDEIRLRQIIFNLVGNALKFTDKGYVRLSVRKEVTPMDKSTIDLIFSIDDTGIGIAKEDQKCIFEAFRQQDKQTSTKFGGTGLGLAITKRLVEMMGGEIKVESEIGKGSSFKVILKNVAVASSIEIADDTAGINPDSIKFDNPTILVVDDYKGNRFLVIEYLKSLNISFIEAADGKEAVEAAETYKPDLILMDLKMPVMDGYEATRIIKANNKLKDIPVISLTASAMKNEEEKITSVGFDGYLWKPVSREEIVTELMKFLPHSIEEIMEANSNISASGNGNGMLFEDISDEVMANLPVILNTLENDIMNEWERVRKSFILDEIEDLAVRIKELGEKYNFDELTNWAEGFYNQAKSFNMDKLPGTLEYFPKLTENIARCLEK